MMRIHPAEGGCDKAWSGAKARYSLHSKHSVITLLMVHSGFSIPAHGKTAPWTLFTQSCQARPQLVCCGPMIENRTWVNIGRFSIPSAQTSDLRPW